MKIFFFTLLLILFSLAFGAFIFYILLFFTWGMIISVDNIVVISVFSSIFMFISLMLSIFKKEEFSKIFSSTIIILFILFIPFYIYVIKDNSKFYKYDSSPCIGKTFSSDYNLTLLTYEGTSMDGFDSITPYNLEDIYYYNQIKKNMSHTLKKQYSIGSKWTVKGLYYHSRNKVNYFLLQSTEDNTEAWIYIRNFNSEQCKIDFYFYEQKGTPFTLYEIPENKKKKMIPYRK